jgi:ferritin-like metal-binding protein YciE
MEHCCTVAISQSHHKKEDVMSVTNLQELFLHALKDIYYAEKQITKALPKMIEKASNPDLKQAFEDHLTETKGQLERLEKAFEKIGEKPSGEKCPAIEGIIQEAEELMGEIDDKNTLDASLIFSAQAVEHYEITRYGSLASWANLLGNSDVAELMAETLEEERHADTLLNRIAEQTQNKKAA